jgi:hypothetical protein
MSWIHTQLASLQAWVSNHEAIGAWLIGLSLLFSIGGLFAVRWLVLAIPHDYFTASRADGWRDHHPLIRWSLTIGKNVVGAILLVLGITMLITPGPGIVTLLLAVIFLDLPGKRALERRIVTLPSVLHVLNLMRNRANRPLIEAPVKIDSV